MLDFRLPAFVLPFIAASADEARRFLTPDEAAEYLGGINSRTVTRWARERYLPAYPIGEGKRRLWRFRQSDLDAWMTARCTLVPAVDAPVRRIN